MNAISGMLNDVAKAMFAQGNSNDSPERSARISASVDFSSGRMLEDCDPGLGMLEPSTRRSMLLRQLDQLKADVGTYIGYSGRLRQEDTYRLCQIKRELDSLTLKSDRPTSTTAVGVGGYGTFGEWQSYIRAKVKELELRDAAIAKLSAVLSDGTADCRTRMKKMLSVARTLLVEEVSVA